MDQNRIGDRGGNLCFSKGGLRQAQVAGHYNEFQFVNNVDYTIDGVMNRVASASADNQAFTSGHTAFSNNNVCAFAVWARANNTLTTTQGAIVSSEDVENDKAVIPLPDMLAGAALVGIITVKAGVSATFTPGTTNLNATNINAVFRDCAAMPSAGFQSTT